MSDEAGEDGNSQGDTGSVGAGEVGGGLFFQFFQGSQSFAPTVQTEKTNINEIDDRFLKFIFRLLAFDRNQRI
jgi:hypothetical protein